MLKLVLWHRCGRSDLHLFFAYVLLICDLSTRILCTLEFSEGIWKDFPCPWEIELCTVNFYPAVQLPFRFKRRLRLQKDFLFMIAAVRFYHGELWLEKSGNPVSELKICSYQQDKVCLHVFCLCLHTRYLCICNVSCKLSQIQLDPMFCLKCMLLKVYWGKSSKFGLFHWVLKS